MVRDGVGEGFRPVGLEVGETVRKTLGLAEGIEEGE